MRNEGTDGAGWASAPAGHLTPADVQQKQFRTARMGGGYRMREVDEFLDQVTDTLTSLLSENERLRRGQAGEPAARSTLDTPITAGDRAAIEAFLRREKAFLQSLGGLVQGHAEELKGMVRSSRSPLAAPGTPAAVVPAAVSTPANATPAAEEPSVEPPAVETSVAATEDVPEESEPPTQVEDDRPVEASDTEDETGAMPAAETETETETEEPIRLDEPEPARSRRTEEGSAGSLRELFWGEE